MTDPASQAPAKKKPQPVYLVVRRLIDPDTGELVGALVPEHRVDADIMRERGYRTGARLRAVLQRPRNAKFHRLAHQIGVLIARMLPGHEGKDAHAALKAIQVEAGVACDETRTPVPGYGELVSRQPQSLSFDRMEEGEFRAVVRGICHHIVTTYWPGMTVEQVEEMAEMMVD